MAFTNNMKQPSASTAWNLSTDSASTARSKVGAPRARQRRKSAASSAICKDPTYLWRTPSDKTLVYALGASEAAFSNEEQISPSKPMLSPSFAEAAGTIGPAAVMVGGTAAVYTSLLHHPSSTLTPLSVLYMLLLAIQTSIQPRLSRRYIPKSANKVRVALVEEMIKTSAASLMFWGLSDKGVVREAIKGWTLKSSLIVAGLPACLYAVQGVLTYMSHQHLDSVTFNGLSQTKTLSAAFCCYLVMGKSQSPLQMVALATLFLSAIMFQTNHVPGSNSSSSSSSKLQPFPKGYDNSINNRYLIKGILPCIVATFISGLAGALSQRGLQIVGGSGRNAFLYTVEVSFFSAVALLVPNLLSQVTSRSMTSNVQGHGKDPSIAASTPLILELRSLIPITCKAMGGILTALVHKHAGSVVKGFALMLGLVMSGILHSLWLEIASDGTVGSTSAPMQSLRWHQVVGIVVVMFSSWLHFTNPPT